MPTWPKEWYMAHLAARRAEYERNNDPPPVDDELPIHDEIIRYCISKRWGYIHANTHRKSRMTVGAPDFTILANGGRTFFVELKSKTGKLRVDQLAFKIQAELNGHTVHVLRSFEAFVKLVES